MTFLFLLLLCSVEVFGAGSLPWRQIPCSKPRTTERPPKARISVPEIRTTLSYPYVSQVWVEREYEIKQNSDWCYKVRSHRQKDAEIIIEPGDLIGAACNCSLPHRTELIVVNNTQTNSHTCTGTLITKKIVLTVAHCIALPPIDGVVLKHIRVDFIPSVKKKTEDYKYTNEYWIHPNYTTFGIDVAIVALPSLVGLDHEDLATPSRWHLRSYKPPTDNTLLCGYGYREFGQSGDLLRCVTSPKVDQDCKGIMYPAYE